MLLDFGQTKGPPARRACISASHDRDTSRCQLWAGDIRILSRVSDSSKQDFSHFQIRLPFRSFAAIIGSANVPLLTFSDSTFSQCVEGSFSQTNNLS
jgi:hypothetical protein